MRKLIVTIIVAVLLGLAVIEHNKPNLNHLEVSTSIKTISRSFDEWEATGNSMLLRTRVLNEMYLLSYTSKVRAEGLLQRKASITTKEALGALRTLNFLFNKWESGRLATTQLEANCYNIFYTALDIEMVKESP